MTQPIRKGVSKPKEPTKKRSTPRIKRTNKTHAISKEKRDNLYQKDGGKYGMSKLEGRFARNFLDKLGVRYVRQWPMGNTKRFCDFMIVDKNILIEVDGDYFHAYGKLYENMDAIQKKNHMVDKYKDRWAVEHGFLMVRIWEHDINNNPSKVMERLKKIFRIDDKIKRRKTIL